jgi:crossover junction endodeoxyribonuclease RuvC
MLILGIDPGLAATGYGLVRGDRQALCLVDYGALETAAGDCLSIRLRCLYRELGTLIERHGPEAVAVEELFFNRNVRTAMAVGHARGVILLAAAEAKLDVFEYTPLQVKDALVGYGRADKAQIQGMLRLLLGMESVPRPDHAADAIAVAVCHLHSARLRAVMEG